MIKLESTLDGAGTIVENDILMTDSEAGAVGEAVVATSGRLTKAAATVAPTFILTKKTTAGTNVATEYVRVREDQVFTADITGTAGAAAVAAAIGSKAVRIDSNGTGIDSDQLTGGKVIIMSVDTAKSKARIKFDI